MNKLSEALRWISEILDRHRIPWQITGGLAAHIYGATRPVNDIDLDIPDSTFAKILPEVKPFVTFGPAHYLDEVWDVQRLQLRYHGQEIDICGASGTRIKDRVTGIWHESPADFTTIERREVCGVVVPVIHRDELIEYKRWIAKPNDHQEQDIQEILEKVKN